MSDNCNCTVHLGYWIPVIAPQKKIFVSCKWCSEGHQNDPGVGRAPTQRKVLRVGICSLENSYEKRETSKIKILESSRETEKWEIQEKQKEVYHNQMKRDWFYKDTGQICHRQSYQQLSVMKSISNSKSE